MISVLSIVFDASTNVWDLLLVKMELEEQIFSTSLGEAEASSSFLLKEKLNEHISLIILHDKEFALVYPEIKR